MSGRRLAYRLEVLAKRVLGLVQDRCPGCTGAVPYEGPAIMVLQHPDGREERLRAHCDVCGQRVDETGKGIDYPVPGRWDPTARNSVIVILEDGRETR